MERTIAHNKGTNAVLKFWKENSYVLALIILVVFASAASGSFLKTANIMNILRQISIVGIIGLGMTFVIISGGIDLSVGSFLAMIGGIIIALQKQNLPVLLSVLIGCIAGLIIGAVNGLIISKARLAPFIVTLVTMTIARSVIIYLSNGSSIIGDSTSSFTDIGNGRITIIPIPVIIFALVIALCSVLLNNTKFGRYVYAIGGNEKTSLYSGIKVDRIKIMAYSLMGLLVAVASVIETSRLASVSSSSSGLFYEMDAIAAVIIGGTPLSGGKGKLMGTVVGIIILGIISNIMNLLNISPYLNGAVKGLIILVAVLMQRREV